MSRELFLDQVPLGDILERLDGADDLARAVAQRSRGEKEPAAAVAKIGEIVFGFESAGNDLRGLDLSLVVSFQVRRVHPVDDQVAQHRPGLAVEDRPLVREASHVPPVLAGQVFAGLVPVSDLVVSVDHECRDRIVVEYLIQDLACLQQARLHVTHVA